MELAMSMAQHNPMEAAAHLEKVCRQDPTNTSAFIMLASIRRKLGQLDKASQLLEAILATDPSRLSVLIECGYLFLDAQKTMEAEVLFRRALALAPDEPKIHFGLASCLLAMGKLAEAQSFRESFRSLDAARQQNRSDKAGKDTFLP